MLKVWGLAHWSESTCNIFRRTKWLISSLHDFLNYLNWCVFGKVCLLAFGWVLNFGFIDFPAFCIKTSTLVKELTLSSCLFSLSVLRGSLSIAAFLILSAHSTWDFVTQLNVASTSLSLVILKIPFSFSPFAFLFFITTTFVKVVARRQHLLEKKSRLLGEKDFFYRRYVCSIIVLNLPVSQRKKNL